MNREKSKRNGLESDEREFPDKRSVSTQEPRVMSFDAYFQKVMSKNSKVYGHHKAPMRHFAEQRGLADATEEQFDEIFRSY